MMVLLAYFSTNHKNRDEDLHFWKAFDNTDYFSVNQPTQRKYILYTGLICLPNVITAGAMIIDWNRGYLYMKHPNIKPYLQSVSPYLDPTLYITLTLLNCICTMLRFRPFMAMFYAIICIRRHLYHLNIQVANYCKKSHHPLMLEIANRDLYQHLKRGRNNSVASDVQSISLYRSTERSSSCFDSIILPESANENANDLNNEDRKAKPELTINNLHELDIHLNRINLFVKQIDIDSSLVVYITIFYHFTVLMYAFFLYREFTISLKHIVIILYNFFGLLPPLALLTCGTLMQREAKDLMTKLEYLYLQEETQCFMYRQMSGMKYPLWSIFKLLDSIEFNCDRLMSINLGTLREIFILLSASALVIIQYGK